MVSAYWPVGENEKTKVSKNKSIEMVGGKPNNAQNTKKGQWDVN